MRLHLMAVLAPLAGCQVPVTLDFPVGPLSYEISTEDLAVPAPLRDGALLRSIPCDGTCVPPEAESPVQLSCVDQVCDPDPFCYTLDLPPVDLAAWEDLSRLGDHVTDAEVRRVLFRVEENTLNVDLPAVAVLWGPETAASAADAQALGTVPSIAAGSTPSGEVPLDPAGAAALGEHFVRTSTVFRLFADTAIDLEPGMPIPQGTLRFTATVDVHLEGEGSL